MPNIGSCLLFSFYVLQSRQPLGDCGTDYHLKGECSFAGLFKKLCPGFGHRGP
jgi:hypothetical protein